VTLLSVFPAIIGSTFALSTISERQIGWWALQRGALIMAVGIGTMHYTGMEAMRMDGVMRYQPAIFALSIVVADLLAAVAIYVGFVFKPSLGSKPWATVLSSIVMGCAVSGMHYTAMSAARFYPSDITAVPGTALSHSFMVISICGVMAIAVGMTLIGTIVDQRLVEASEALRESEALSRLLIDSADEGILGLDREGKTTFVNPSVTRLLGFAPSDLIGKPIHGLIHHSHADGSPYPADECPVLKTCSDGSLHHFSNELLWKMDGTTLRCEYTSTPVSKEGELIGAVLTVRDISARLQQEERAERARNAAEAKAAIAKVMQEARPLKERLNTALELLFSMSGTDGPNRGGVFLTHPETKNLELFCARGDVSEHDEEDEEWIEHERIPCEHAGRVGKIIVSSGDFDKTPASTSFRRRYIIPIMQAESCMGVAFWHSGSVALYEDIRVEMLEQISEILGVAAVRHWAELELKRARDGANSATKAKGQFLATMSHEIRTPMNGVLGMTQLLLDTELSGEQRDYAETIHTSANALLTIINDILDFSKIEAGKLDIEPVPFDLQIATSEVADLLAAKAEKQGIELVVRYVPGAARYLVGDPGRIRQILLNLGDNAVKFTSKGSVLLQIEELGRDDEKAELKLSVHDTGIGIDKSSKEKVFESFGQADASTTRKFGGTGLGLSIARQLVSLMGGELGVDSVPGQGSTFWFTLILPLAPAPQNAPNEISLSGIRILVVDDGDVNRRVLREQLEGWRMRADTASSGKEGLERLREAASSGDPYQMAILDFLMPGMDGASLGRIIQSDAKISSTRLVLMSSSARRGDGQHMLQAGFSGFLVKPARGDTLRDVLATVQAEPRGARSPDRQLVTRYSVAEAKAATSTPKSERPRDIYRVLVAEDNIVNQKVAMAMLQTLGCRVDVAANGQEAVNMLSRLSYDIVFMDCQMPELDGYEATASIRDEEGSARHTPIVAMTASALPEDRERCLKAGMDDYISKPVTKERLLEVLQQWAGGQPVEPSQDRTALSP